DLSNHCVMNNETLSSGVLTSSVYSNFVFSNNFFTGHMCASITNLTPAGALDCTGDSTLPVDNVTIEHNSFIDDTTVGFDGATNIVVDYNEWEGHVGLDVALNNVVGADVTHNHR